MRHLRLTDVTLRDGGYRNNFSFDRAYAHRVVEQLSAAGVDYCEVGYCNGPFRPAATHGLTARVTPGYLQALAEAASGGTRLAVMVHPHNVQLTDLAMLKASEVSLLRVCLRPSQLAEGLATVAQAKDLGLEVSANLTHISQLSAATLAQLCLRAEAAGADLITLADSNGSLLPVQVKALFERLLARCVVPLGFHAHNNLSLALANTLAALEAGVECIDASLCGMGKGAGNLNLALFVASLQRTGQPSRYDLSTLLALSEHTAERVSSSHLPAPWLDLVTGAFDLPFDAQATIAELIASGQAASTVAAAHRLQGGRS